MIAQTNVIVDGKWYAAGETIHDLGDLERTDKNDEGMKHDYVGVTATEANFPHYVATGSTITMLDESNGATIYMFHAPSDNWYEI